jgi:hypothetical protein
MSKIKDPNPYDISYTLPITGEQSEWIEVDTLEIFGGNFSFDAFNSKCGSLIKRDDDFVLMNAVCMVDNCKISIGFFHRSVEDYRNDNPVVTNFQQVKSFPFVPMRFNVDVEDIEVDGETITVAKYPEQVDMIWEYYVKPKG